MHSNTGSSTGSGAAVGARMVLVDRDEAAAIKREMELSLEARRQESQGGAARFASGEGRHGQFKK